MVIAHSRVIKMNFRHKKPEELDVNITPLVDVVFLLLIFFMVSTTFDRQSELNIELPEANGEITKSEKKEIEIFIKQDGKYIINGQVLVNSKIDTLIRNLRHESGGDEGIRVIISADKLSTHQAVMTVMDAARQVGLIHITFSAVKSD